MKTFFGVIVDCSPKVFKISACSSRRPAPPDVFATGFPSYLRQLLVAPEFVEPMEAPVELDTILLSIAAIVVVDQQNVSNFDFFDVTELSLWLILGRNVGG